MAQLPSPIKLFQIEEPDGSQDAADGFGVAVGIALSRAKGASVAASVGGNAQLVVSPDGTGINRALSEQELSQLLRDLRALTEKAMAQPVTHAVILIDGFEFPDGALLRAAAGAEIALLGIRQQGTALDAAIEAEDIAGVLSR
jgi:hypothetical protein